MTTPLRFAPVLSAIATHAERTPHLFPDVRFVPARQGNPFAADFYETFDQDAHIVVSDHSGLHYWHINYCEALNDWTIYEFDADRDMKESHHIEHEQVIRTMIAAMDARIPIDTTPAAWDQVIAGITAKKGA